MAADRPSSLEGSPAPRRPDRIVVGVDRSPTAEAALRWACTEVRRRRLDLQVVHCSIGGVGQERGGAWRRNDQRSTALDRAPFGDGESWHDLRRFRAYLETVVRDELGETERVAFELWPLGANGPAGTLGEAARGAVALVVGSRGEAALSALVLGSVSRACLQVATVPVVIVSTRPRALTGVVMVGVDGSEQSFLALGWAADEAARRGAALVLAHCYSSATIEPNEDPTVEVRSAVRLEADTSVLYERMLRRLEEERGPLSIRTSYLAVPDRAGSGLLDAAGAADLLVLGSGRRSVTAGLLIGSVTEQALARCPCPVVALPRRTLKRDAQEVVPCSAP